MNFSATTNYQVVKKSETWTLLRKDKINSVKRREAISNKLIEKHSFFVIADSIVK